MSSEIFFGSHSRQQHGASTCSLLVPDVSSSPDGSPPHTPSDDNDLRCRRRCTLSIAIADERVTDEVLVEELERIRHSDGTPGLMGFVDVWDASGKSSDSHHPSWTISRRALLTVREFVRTERHYLFSLRALLGQGHVRGMIPLLSKLPF